MKLKKEKLTKAFARGFCMLIFSLAMDSCVKPVDEQELSIYNPMTFSFYNGDISYYLPFTDPVAKEITARTGITLEVVPSKFSTIQDVPMMIASGRYQDFIYAKSGISDLIEANALVALDDWVSPTGEHINLIERYGQNFKALYGDQLVKLRHSDGHIYTFGTYEIKQAINETTGIMQIQHAVLKELGYPRIRTLEDFSMALRAYVKKHPTIYGKKTIGLSLLIKDWLWYVGLSNPGNYVIGYPDDGQWIVDRSTHEAQYKFLNPEMDQYYRWLNGLYNEGLLDPESFTQTEDMWKAKILSGSVLSMSSPGWEFKDVCKDLVADGMPERTYAYLPIVADADRYKDPSLTDYGYSGGWGISISKSCKNVELAFKFIDWMCSEEAQILMNWGIEGVNYVVKDGRRQIPESEMENSSTDSEYSRKTGVGLWVYPFPECGSGATDKNGDWMTRDFRERVISTYLPVEKETLSEYGVQMWTELFPQSDELYRPVHGQIWQYHLPKDVNDIVEAADDYVRNALVSCIINPPDEFDERWKAMVDELKKMGVEKAGKKLSEMIREKLDLWYGK
ncbi:MAG: ABC transporter substrate-binding protein [Treponema sp.]|nr:ABC transporter substrate-binding protein [Treponema sp.]